MEIGLGEREKTGTISRYFVSILVFMEIGLGVRDLLRAEILVLVSILVFMEIGLGVSIWLPELGRDLVSILVFMEIGLGVWTPKPHSNDILCFNPCFYGNRSGRKGGKKHKRLLIKFQSLFLWKSVWEPHLQFGHKWQYLVSILVFMEIGLGVYNSVVALMTGNCFNPCFYGNRSGRQMPLLPEITLLSFNPCFYGNRSGSRGSGYSGDADPSFRWY